MTSRLILGLCVMLVAVVSAEAGRPRLSRHGGIPTTTIDPGQPAPFTLYASPTSPALKFGGAAGLTPASGGFCTLLAPCTLTTAITSAQPGERVVMLVGNGTTTNKMLYRGANDRIDVANKSGTAANRITIQCEVDGACLIDQQFQVRIPINFASASYFTVTGIDACCSGSSPTGNALSVVRIQDASSWLEIKRGVFWDSMQSPDTATVGASNTITVQGGTLGDPTDILFEDIGAFGVGQRHGRCFHAHRVTYRRVWMRQDGPSGIGGPPSIFNPARVSGTCVMENGVLQWLADMPGSDAGNGIRNTKDLTTPGAVVKILGTLVQDKGLGLTSGGLAIWLNCPTCIWDDPVDPVQIQDLVTYVPPTGTGTPNRLGTGQLNNCTSTVGGSRGPCVGNSVTRFTTIGPTNHSIGSEWTQSAICHATSPAGCPSVWSSSQTPTGASLCFRYVDGVRTTEKLWPWPMDERIRQAVIHSGHTLLVGGSVTAEVEAVLGTIPSQCKG